MIKRYCVCHDKQVDEKNYEEEPAETIYFCPVTGEPTDTFLRIVRDE
jgi:hypothetical protein